MQPVVPIQPVSSWTISISAKCISMKIRLPEACMRRDTDKTPSPMSGTMGILHKSSTPMPLDSIVYRCMMLMDVALRPAINMVADGIPALYMFMHLLLIPIRWRSRLSVEAPITTYPISGIQEIQQISSIPQIYPNPIV